MEPDNQPIPAPLTGEVLPPPGTKPAPLNPLAVVSMVLGILATITPLASWLCCLCFAGVPALLMGPAAVVCGHLSLKQIREARGSQQGRPVAIAGLVTGYLGIVLGLLVMILFAVLIGVSWLTTGSGAWKMN